MQYSKEVYEKVKTELNSRRERAESEAKTRHDEFAKTHPDILIIENEMAKTGIDAVNAVFNGMDPKRTVKELARLNISLQKDRAGMLRDCGLDENYLNPQYTCKKCGDKGYIDGEICSCQSELLKKYSCEALYSKTPLKLSSFNDFNLSFYSKSADGTGISPFKRMTDIYGFCKDYAEDFSCESPNLFMFGNTGLGKTHLSLSIAGKVIEKGYGVIYDSAQNLFTKLERERFGKDNGTTIDTILSCDMLILDDLGAEFDTKYVVSEIYNIINTRISAGLPTIISSNISLNELTGRYGERVTSRIIGEYHQLYFQGKDIRQLKKRM